MLVLQDARIATDLLRALCVVEEVRIVRLLPHEDQVSGGHEACDKCAPGGGTGEWIRPDAEPAAVVCLLAAPQLFLPAELPLGEDGVPRLDAALLHREKATRLDRASFGHSRSGVRQPARSRSRAGVGRASSRAHRAPCNGEAAGAALALLRFSPTPRRS